LTLLQKILLPAILGITAAQSWAARPFVTDDARLTTAGSCQLESWMRVYPDSREFWALPACNPGGNLEFTLGGGHAKVDGEQATNDYLVQAKTLFRPLESNDWGWGLALGTIRHPDISPGPNLLGNVYAYVPLSVSFNDDSVVMHTNIGWLKDRASGTHNMTWGVGGEFKIASRLLAIAETFGDNHNQPYWQLGGRFAIVPNRVQVDATLGQQFSGSSSRRWISFGLRLTPERLF
jgi:hypothetical protein